MVLFQNLFVAGLARNNEKTSDDWPNFRQAALHFVPRTADFSHCLHCFQRSERSERSFGSTAVIVCSVLNVGKQAFGKRSYGLQRFYRLERFDRSCDVPSICHHQFETVL